MGADVIELPTVLMDRSLTAARAGDPASFAALVREHQSMVFSIAYHAMRDAAIAEELAQDVFLEMYRRLDEIQSGRHLLFWLRKVTSNRCIDELRRRRAARPVPIDDIGDHHAAGEPRDVLLHERLKNLVGDLPEKQRLAIILRYQEEMEPSEISAAIGVPVNTVKSHIQRALAALRSKLDFGMSAPARSFMEKRR